MSRPLEFLNETIMIDIADDEFRNFRTFISCSKLGFQMLKHHLLHRHQDRNGSVSKLDPDHRSDLLS